MYSSIKTQVIICSKMAMAGKLIVLEKDVHSFIIRCLEAIGTNTEHAKALADALTCADTRGIYSHGLSRIGKVMVNSHPYSILSSSFQNFFYQKLDQKINKFLTQCPKNEEFLYL